MKSLTVYIVNDGLQFDTECQALAHDAMIEKVKQAMLPLGKTPRKVEDGKGWVQHSKESYRTVHHDLIKLAIPLFKGCDNAFVAAAKNNPDSIHPLGVAGRIISECDSPIDDGWRRLGCIDSQYREHQQPYFAINGPDKDHVCVEDRS